MVKRFDTGELGREGIVLYGEFVLASDYDTLESRIRELEAELAKERGGWDAFLKLRKSVAERDFPGLTGEIRTSDADLDATREIRMLLLDGIRCRAPINTDVSRTHIRIDWPDGHEILVSRESAARLRDWLNEVLDADDADVHID